VGEGCKDGIGGGWGGEGISEAMETDQYALDTILKQKHREIKELVYWCVKWLTWLSYCFRRHYYTDGCQQL